MDTSCFPKIPKVLVIGSGSWGTALACQLVRAGTEVILTGNDPLVLEEILNQQSNSRYLPDIALEKMAIAPDLKAFFSTDASSDLDAILIAVPSRVFSVVLEDLRELSNLSPASSSLFASVGIIWGSKGLSRDGHFLHEVVQTIFPNHQKIALLSGPSFAREVAMNCPTAVSLVSKDLVFAKKTAQYFQQGSFSVYLSTDLIGAQIGGVCKNIYAFGAGLIEGLGYGKNAVIAFLTRALSEMIAVSKALGGSPETIMGLSGCGDLFLTATDNQSRNKRFGFYVGQGLEFEKASAKIGQVVEVLDNTEIYYNKVKNLALDLPLLTEIYAILKMNKDPNLAIQNLFNSKLELEFK